MMGSFFALWRIIMQRFLGRHGSNVVGVLSGWDRLLFRGTLRSISYAKGMDKFLGYHSILYKDFAGFAQRISDRLKTHARAIARRQGRPFRYLPSSAISKEDVARRIMEQHNIQRGLVCVLSCVEPCQSYTLRRNPDTKHLELIPAQRKCLHLYFYYVDREFGLMHIRLQTWLPLSIQVCLNGRQYLARRMNRAGIGYEQRGNCFVRIDDLPKAQRMMDDLLKRNWIRFLNVLGQRVNPWLHPANGLSLRGYYWSLRQSEYATDLLFTDTNALQQVYPVLAQHAIQHFHPPDILRFLGRRTNARFSGEVTTDAKRRAEGVRIKHWVEENSIKMYDKEGTILRIETTINKPRRFKVRRMATRKGHRQLAWIPMRKGVADMTRRAEICRAANERYLEALGVVGEPSPTRHLFDPLSKRITRRGRPYRGLRPIHPEEARLFAAVLDGQFFLQGFRNKDLRRRLHPAAEPDPVSRKRASGRITRCLRLLRAHGLIAKVSRTFYYRITRKGHHVMTTALKLRQIDLSLLAA